MITPTSNGMAYTQDKVLAFSSELDGREEVPMNRTRKTNPGHDVSKNYDIFLSSWYLYLIYLFN